MRNLPAAFFALIKKNSRRHTHLTLYLLLKSIIIIVRSIKISEVLMIITNIILLTLLGIALFNGVNIATHTLFDKPHKKI